MLSLKYPKLGALPEKRRLHLPLLGYSKDQFCVGTIIIGCDFLTGKSLAKPCMLN